jgi:GNAT superfamily N-acetyltransferase
MIRDLRQALEQVSIATTDGDIADCFDCMHSLRPRLERDDFVARVRDMEPGGFRLAFIRDKGNVVALAGFRPLHTLFAGNTLYVDDLVTSPLARSRGYGRILIDWLQNHATEQGCTMLHLDSGVQRARAHKFYFDSGFHVNCFHFAMLLDEEGR